MDRTRPPFRADHVGSLLRPPELLRAREDFAAGRIPADELRGIEDIAIHMIDNDLAFVQGVDTPFALGGLVGSLFFAGYMLTQFPGGYLGDKYGHRTIIVISVVWAGVATLLSGLMTGLVLFVALRVITGLGEGTFYSNDRSVITEQTPFEKRSFGMGVVITGLSIGLTLAFLLTPPLIGLGDTVFGAEEAWRMPFSFSASSPL